MGMNVGESHAVTTIREYLMKNLPPSGPDHYKALATLSDGAYRRMQAGMTGAAVREAWRTAGARSGVLLDRDRLEQWAGRPLTDEEIARIGDVVAFSTVPEAIGTIVSSF